MSTRIHHLHSKYAPHNSDYVEYMMTPIVKNILPIVTFRYNCEITTEYVPIEIITIAIYTLSSSLHSTQAKEVIHME